MLCPCSLQAHVPWLHAHQVSPACPAPPLSLEALRGLLRSARGLELGLLAHGVALEALLDEVAHAGAAPVAASIKREIVRQHLQLQVFEAVPA